MVNLPVHEPNPEENLNLLDSSLPFVSLGDRIQLARLQRQIDCYWSRHDSDHSAVKILVAIEAVDGRKGIDSLAYGD